MNYKKLGLTAVILVLVDLVFLYLIGQTFGNMVKSIQKTDMKLNHYFAMITYLILVFQLYYFIVEKNGTLLDAFILGSTTYGIFDFTNLSVFKNYRPHVGVIDTIWGGILYALTIFILRALERYI